MSTATSPPRGGLPGSAYAAYLIAVLWLVTVCSQLDRQLPALLVGPLRSQFGISDTQFSLLQGYAFAAVYTLVGLPMGRWVDAGSRRTLIVVGVLLWSAMTAASAFATTFGELLLLRMGVGVGEAVLAPAAYSLIADCVPVERRGRALAAYYVSLAIGSGASLLIGGLILRAVPAGGAALPAIGTVARWQATFLIAGSPGVLLALLVATLREPPRTEARGGGVPTLRAVVGHVARYGSAFARLFTYPALLAMTGYAILAWAPALLDRRFGLPPSRSGPALGAIVAAAGLSGTLLSGYLSDRWLSRGVPAARFRLGVVAWLIALPAAPVWPLLGSPAACLAVLGVAVFGISIGQAAAPASIQDLVPNRMRGQAIAIYLLVAGLLGIGLGPTSVALVTDHVFGRDAALPMSLAVVALPTCLLGAWWTASGVSSYAAAIQSFRAAGDFASSAHRLPEVPR